MKKQTHKLADQEIILIDIEMKSIDQQIKFLQERKKTVLKTAWISKQWFRYRINLLWKDRPDLFKILKK